MVELLGIEVLWISNTWRYVLPGSLHRVYCCPGVYLLLVELACCKNLAFRQMCLCLVR